MIDNVLYTRTEINDGFYHTTIIKDEHPTELYLYSLEYSNESNIHIVSIPEFFYYIVPSVILTLFYVKHRNVFASIMLHSLSL